MPEIEQAHARFLNGEAMYSEDYAAMVAGHLDDVATHASRSELVEAISAAYAAIGVHEDWLASVAEATGGTDAAACRDDQVPSDEPLGSCVVHGDYWGDDCLQCRRER